MIPQKSDANRNAVAKIKKKKPKIPASPTTNTIKPPIKAEINPKVAKIFISSPLREI
jgi:hypothetical protein